LATFSCSLLRLASRRTLSTLHTASVTEPPLLGTSRRQLTLERPVSSCHTACLEVSAEQLGPWFGLVVLSTMSVAYQRLSEFKVTADSTKGWSTSMWRTICAVTVGLIFNRVRPEHMQDINSDSYSTEVSTGYSNNDNNYIRGDGSELVERVQTFCLGKFPRPNRNGWLDSGRAAMCKYNNVILVKVCKSGRQCAC